MTAPSLGERLRLGSRALRSAVLTLDQLARLERDRRSSGVEAHAALAHVHKSRWAERMLRTFGLDVHAVGPWLSDGLRVPGSDARGVGRMFVLNHRSALDVFLALRYFDGFAVSRADVEHWPLVGFCARRVGTLFVDRGNAASGATVIAAMARALASGHGILIFPEGTVFPGDEVRPLKSGAFRAARQAGAEIVPVGLCYEDVGTAYGEEGFLAHVARVGSMRRIGAALHVGEPIPSEGTVDELRARTREAIQRCVTAARATLSSRS